MSRILHDIETRDDFKKLLTENRVVVIKASAIWCNPCKKIAPYVDDLFKQLPSNVYLICLDVDEGEDLSTFLRIRKLPTFISFVGEDKMDILESANPDNVKKFFQKVKLHADLLRKIKK